MVSAVTPDLPEPNLDPAPGLRPSFWPWLPWLGAGFALGCALPAVYQPQGLWWWLLAAWAVGAPLMLLAPALDGQWRGLPRRCLGFLVCVLAGMAAVGPSHQRQPPPSRLLVLEAQVERVLYAGYSVGFLAYPQRGQHPDLPRLIKIIAPPTAAVRLADTIQVQGLLTEEVTPWGDRRPLVKATRLVVIERREDGPRGWAWSGLERLAVHRELAASLLLGAGRPPERSDFHQAGLLHLLAVSGLHLGIALVLLAWLMRLCGLSWALRLTILAGGALAYGSLVGWSLPTQRAAAMTLAVVLYQALGRQAHPLGPLSLAVLLLLILDPTQARAPGFQLSVAAVLGIVTMGLQLVALRRRYLPLQPWPLDRPLWRGCLIGARGACDGLAIGIAATLAVSPITAGHFGEITPWSACASVVAGPCLSLILFTGLPLMLLQGHFPGGPWEGLHLMVDGALAALVRVAEVSAALPGSLVTVPAPPLITWLLWPLMFFELPVPTPWRWPLRAIAGGLAVGLWVVAGMFG